MWPVGLVKKRYQLDRWCVCIQRRGPRGLYSRRRAAPCSMYSLSTVWSNFSSPCPSPLQRTNAMAGCAARPPLPPLHCRTCSCSSCSRSVAPAGFYRAHPSSRHSTFLLLYSVQFSTGQCDSPGCQWCREVCLKIAGSRISVRSS